MLGLYINTVYISIEPVLYQTFLQQSAIAQLQLYAGTPCVLDFGKIFLGGHMYLPIQSHKTIAQITFWRVGNIMHIKIMFNA
eukprot:8643123-Ditylum_brightwellii.AAC.1